MEKIAVIGASRGLGAQLCLSIPPEHSILGIGRKTERLAALRTKAGYHFEGFAADLNSEIDRIIAKLAEYQPSRLFYLAAGGPYGPYSEKSWKDHLWAWKVSFLGAAQIVHAALNFERSPHQIVLCGSSVAEAEGDALAASYASAKHALKGLYQSLRLENPQLDIRLFSPGYLDTELLPKGAAVRYKGVWNPEVVAQEFWDWACSSDHAGHRSYSRHPN